MTASSDAIDLLTSQFGDAEITQDVIRAMLAAMDETDTAIDYLLDSTHLPDAEGVWLDNEGAIVGAARILAETPESEIFTYIAGTSTGTSTTQGYDGGKLRGFDGNYIPGTLMGDAEYRDYINAKARATFQGSSLRDIADFVYDAFGVVSKVDFSTNSDVIIYLAEHIPYSEQRIIERYAPVSAGSKIVAIYEGLP